MLWAIFTQWPNKQSFITAFLCESVDSIVPILSIYHHLGALFSRTTSNKGLFTLLLEL